MKLLRKRISPIFLVAMLLCGTPMIFWHPNTYLVGGDDSRLYYLFPDLIIKNYNFSLYSQNNPGVLGGYTSISYLYPFFFALSLIKNYLPFLNTQTFAYGLNISLGFAFFILLSRLLTKTKPLLSLEIFAGLFYVFSSFSLFTLWKHQLLPVYLVSFFPISLYLFIKGLRSNSLFYTALLSLVISFYAIILMSLPWLLGTIICSLPLLIYLLIRYKFRFISHLLVLMLLCLSQNAYWLFHYVYSVISARGTGLDIISSNLTQSKVDIAAGIIKDAVSGNSVLFPLFGQFHLSVVPVTLYFPLFVIFPLVIFFGLVKSKKVTAVNISIVVCWITALYFFTVEIFGVSGLKIFLWLNSNVKGFNMFRFMYDKFGYALSFYFAFSVYQYLHLLGELKKSKISKAVVVLLFSILILYSQGFILDDQHKGPILGTRNTYPTITNLNQDYYDLVGYLRDSTDEAKIAWLPLNTANYSPVSDNNLPNHYFFGVSPLIYLANKTDLTGTMSFGPYGEELVRSVYSGDIMSMGRIFQKLNVNYIILNRDLSLDIAESYIYPQGIFEKQTRPENLKIILGDKIKDFGNRYSLYTINKRFASQRFRLFADKDSRPREISTKSLSPYLYDLKIEVGLEQKTLQFVEFSSSLWQIQNDKGEEIALEKIIDQGYGNRWKISEEICKLTRCSYENGIKIASIKVYFSPEKYDKFVRNISRYSFGITFCLLILTLVLLLKSRYKIPREVYE